MEAMNRPKIRDDKTRFNITLKKEHKTHLEEVADSLGISLNSLFVMCAMQCYPLNRGEKNK